MPALVAGTDIVLGNEEDAQMVLGIKAEGVDVTGGHIEAAAYESVSKQIMTRFPRCKKVITTLRGSVNANHNSWSGVLWDGEQLFESPTYEITHIVDRVGGGDSFMGGLIYGLLTYPGNQQALNFAVAASCLKHTIYGDYNQVTVDEVEKLMAGDASGLVAGSAITMPCVAGASGMAVVLVVCLEQPKARRQMERINRFFMDKLLL